jgi:hypothetical protein
VREARLTHRRFQFALMTLFIGLFVAVGLQFYGGLAATTTPDITSGIAGKCLDDTGNSTTNGNKVEIWTCLGNANQEWLKSGKLVKINGKCLDVLSGGITNHTKVDLYTCNGGANQSWSFQYDQMVSAASGKCLDDPGSTTTNGTQLQIYTCNRSAAQVWIASTFTPPIPVSTPVKTPLPTPVPTARPTAIPVPTHIPTPVPTSVPTSGGGSGGSSGGLSDGGSSQSGISGAFTADSGGSSLTSSTVTVPSTPGGFSALASGSNAVIDLTWLASTDAAGVANYQIERSEDQVNWTVLSSDVSTTDYSDTTVTFGVHYYYRLEALDTAGVPSAYAYADATTANFTQSAGNGQGSSSYQSDDSLVSVMLPAGAVDSGVDCSVTSGGTQTIPASAERIVEGPYTLVCKDAQDNIVSSYNDPLSWTFNLKGKLNGFWRV